MFERFLLREKFEVFGWGNRFYGGALVEHAVYGVQEFLPIIGIVLPCVFAIQNDADNMRSGGILFLKLRADVLQALHQVGSSFFARGLGIGETDFVG